MCNKMCDVSDFVKRCYCKYYTLGRIRSPKDYNNSGYECDFFSHILMNNAIFRKNMRYTRKSHMKNYHCFLLFSCFTSENAYYIKTCLKQPLSKRQLFKTNYCLMQVKSIAECSMGSILQYFRASLSYHFSLISLFCLFLSDCFPQVLL